MLSTLTTQAYISATESVRAGIRRFKENQQGVTAIEYGLIAVAVAVLIIAAFYSENSFIKKLQSKFSSLASGISNQNINFRTRN
ncbi:Flp family type IVb pilin [[Haemophilus] ducreyi]|uniref:Flp family type IVb pilin n=2 Tax=Haemophilus ducreyi TaxID=730 RepID=UPI0006565C53|nr:Flp family type IVb pilin [[Haemophilus] ducreyi]AKO48274.1 fimbrial protein [[Haemophilus] ducreyi]AKO49664.1 fimbrial protein [[Haemophilus] ducreyi]